jgi:hypothetical protein
MVHFCTIREMEDTAPIMHSLHAVLCKKGLLATQYREITRLFYVIHGYLTIRVNFTILNLYG